MGVKNSERCEVEFSDNLEPPRCRNKAVEYFGGLDVCMNCYNALEKGYVEFIATGVE